MCNLGIKPECFNPRILFVFKRTANHKCPVAYHNHDFSTLIYVLSGSSSYKIDDKLYKVKKGDVIAINPDIYHGKTLELDEEITELHIGINNISLPNLPKDFLIDSKNDPIVVFNKHGLDFYRCCYEIIKEQDKNELGSELLLKALVMKLLVIYLREIKASEDKEEQNSLVFDNYDKVGIVTSIIEYMNENYMKSISLDKISRNIYLSPVYISKIFKEETGESPINYLIKIRLSMAMKKLEQGKLSIKEISESVGYNDAYHFSKLFKKKYGFPPSKYKPN